LIWQQEVELTMRKLILIGGSLLGILLAGGCATPAYSAGERSAMIQRNFDYNGKQAVDDWDDLFLLRPASHMTVWSVQ
jgi:hypothetical protein